MEICSKIPLTHTHTNPTHKNLFEFLILRCGKISATISSYAVHYNFCYSPNKPYQDDSKEMLSQVLF